ncbi:MAG: hypothetical protein KDA31_08870 [Phycisphaerales bacterium]|nr:hypothetical protein [Phycisphaerales bacterium]MCB9836912.1 hypothetical protein [Phycisphaera sp.]
MNHLVRVLCLLAALALKGLALADEFTDRLNANYANVPDSRRAELILMPALGAMEEPPGVIVGRADRVLLLTTSSPAWAAASAWAEAEPQRAALAALAEVTAEENPRRRMDFALPYGIVGIDPSWVRMGIHAELGDPPTISAAHLGYLERMEWLATLAQIEVTRLESVGQLEQATELMFDLAILGRMMADRQLYAEVSWGFETMQTAMLRIRDIAYVDATNDGDLTGAYFKTVVSRIDLNGLFRLDRVRMPTGDQTGAQQLAQRVFSRSGQPDESVFATSMAELASTSRPLRLFAEAGRWQSVMSGHASSRETNDKINGLFNDWSLRWSADVFDPTFRTPTEYERLDRQSFALVAEVVPNLGRLFVMRRELETELVGTRVALAIRALSKEAGGMPSSLALARPRYIDDLGVDPYNPSRAANNRPELRFFVPERDTVGGRLHQMNVIPSGRTNFSVRLGSEQFVLYSLGGNEFDDRAEIVSDSGLELTGDYLIWPPVLSILRDYLEQTGDSE